MYSMDFEEFLWGKGYDERFIEEMLEHMRTLKPFNEVQLSVCSALFLDYCILGGMPAVVREFIEKGTFEGSLEVQRQLVADYKEDIRKYADGLDQTRILNVFQHIPVQLAKENKKFQISKVASGARFRDYRGCIEWLSDAGMVNVCHCLHFPELPLKGNYDETKYKLYFADTGLLVAMLDEEAQDDLRANKNLGVYKGALYENIVGEALVKAGYQLYYYKRDDSTLEQDFFVRTASDLIPVEVKAKNGTAKSMRTLIHSEKYADIHAGIKFTGGNIGYSDDIYIPSPISAPSCSSAIYAHDPKTGQPRTVTRRFGAVSVAFLLALPGQMGYTKVLPSKPAKGIHYGKKDLVSLVFRPGPGADVLRPRRSDGSAGRRHDPPRRHDLPRLSLHL